MAIDWQKYGTALQAAGEGFAGRGAQWQLAQARKQQLEAIQRQQEEAQRQRDMQIQQAKGKELAAYTYGQIGNWFAQQKGPIDIREIAEPLTLHFQGLQQMGGNPAQISQFAEALRNPETAEQALREYMRDAQPTLGVSTQPHTNIQYTDSGVIGYNPATRQVESIPSPEGANMAPQMTPYQQESIRLRNAELEMQKAQNEARAQSLTPKLQEYQLTQDSDYQSALAAGSSAASLADQYAAQVGSGGVPAQFEEFVRGITGSQDGVTAIRTAYTRLRNSLALNDLPPGVASDKDIAIAMSGYPKPTDNPDYISSFLKGMAKVNRFKAAQALYNKNFLTANRNIDNKDRYWKAPIEIETPGGKYKTSLAEIYYSAMEAGVTVKEMLDMAGVTDPKILKVIGY